ncbi:MAG: hypothetical protein PHW77_05205 [Eubacteriales bacterium]|nr:hypothetical protein [Eubacteriales bacterium]
MDSGLGDKIREILGDPQAMEKIMQIVSGLSPPQGTTQTQPGADTSSSVPTSAAPPSLGNISSALSALTGKSGLDSLAALSPTAASGDRRIALLSTLRPLLREEKRQKLDNLKTAFTIANVLGNFKKRT